MITEPKIFVVLPPQSADATAATIAAGAIPVIDLAAGDCTEVPQGAWVRVPAGQEVPDAAGFILTGDNAQPIEGRVCYLESNQKTEVPTGFEGVIYRGKEAGGHCGDAQGTQLISANKGGLLEINGGPQEAANAMKLGASGVVLRDVLWGLPEMKLGANPSPG